MKHSLRTLSLTILAAATLLPAAAALPQPTVAQMGGNNYAYPHLASAPAQTPPPAGYKPFHIEHYGRHGSRYHIGDWHYDYPVNALAKADEAGVLTPLGKELLDSARVYKAQAFRRDGELSDIGALQHQTIGRRIGTNFPEIFETPGTHLDAKSTTVRRCILSMLNEVKELQGLYPHLNVTTDCSEADMYYMNACWGDTAIVARREAAKKTTLKDFKSRYDNDGTLYLPKIISDADYARDSVDAPQLASALIQLLQMTQSHSNQDGLGLMQKVFTYDEIRDEWMKHRASWFLDAGNTPMTGGDASLEHAWLLNNFIESADTAVTSAKTSANLRFGHDTIVLPLAILMQLGNHHSSYDTLEALDGNWTEYDIIPMAGNVQMVFFRPEGSTSPDDVLVKVMLNEQEMSLPVASVSGPYVKWNDLRAYYKNIIDPYISTHTHK